MKFSSIKEGVVFILPGGYRLYREKKDGPSFTMSDKLVGDYVITSFQYRPGWHHSPKDPDFQYWIWAKRLDRNGRWKDNGAEIRLHTGSENERDLVTIPIENLKLKKHMKRTYVDEK